MSPAEILAAAIGHVRNATWQLLGNNQPDGLGLGLECLDLEALLNPDDIDPDVPNPEPSPAASLSEAARLLRSVPDQVAPAAWPVLASLTAKLG
ncbi:MAG: hypothetical protein QM779_11530 [Propionicimonas sp.]|uniref:hypothetical protein n=1 Tax=Propionicimonas sp. TaxID=1955623 RepID=UPI003D0A64E9